MGRWQLASVLAVSICVTSYTAAQEMQQVARRNGWLDDYAAARRAARASGKPLFVVFRCQP